MTVLKRLRSSLCVCVCVAALVMCSVGSQTAHAGEMKIDRKTRQLSVEEVVFLALQQSGELSMYKRGPILQGAFAELERGAYNPELFAEISHEKRNTTELSRSTGEQFDVTLEQTQGEVGLTQTTPTGTSVTATVSTERNNSSRTPVQYGTRLGMSLTQQLLRGMRPEANLATIHQAQADVAISRHELKGFVQALVAEVETTYWQFVRASEEIAVFEKSFEVAVANRDDAKERVTVGALPQNELATREAEVSMREQLLSNARSHRDALKIQLLRFMNPLSFNPEDKVEPTTRIAEVAAIQVDLKDSISLAEQRRSDLQEAMLRLQKGELEISVTRNGILPKLELFADLGKTGYAESFGGSYAAISGSTYDALIGVRFSHRLGNQAARARRQAAVMQKADAAQAVENLRSLIRYDVLVAANELERAHRQMEITARTRSFRSQAVAAEQARFEVGTSAALAVIQAERDLLESEIDEVTAKVDYQIAKIHLYAAEGSLLERRGIETKAEQ